MASIERDILDWAKGRPTWLRNLLKRIARGETIDDDYITSVAQAIVEKKGHSGVAGARCCRPPDRLRGWRHCPDREYR